MTPLTSRIASRLEAEEKKAALSGTPLTYEQKAQIAVEQMLEALEFYAWAERQILREGE